MTDIKTLSPEAAIEAVYEISSIEELRAVAKDLGISFSGNSGLDSLKTKVISVLETKADGGEVKTDPDLEKLLGGSNEEIQVAKIPEKTGPSIAELLEMDETKEPDANLRRMIIRAKALRLVRVRIQNLDPNDSMLSGGIISVQSKYTGKVAKYVPYGDESANGYHIPQIIYDHMKEQKFALRKEVKGGRFGVKTYKTSMVNKFAIEVLPPLTPEEIAELAALQRASQAIDN